MTVSGRADLAGVEMDMLEVLNLPPRALDTLLDLLEEGADIDPFNAPDLLGISGSKIEPLLRLLENNRLGRDCLLVSLRTSAAAVGRVVDRSDECTLCWTGPPNLEVAERSTDAVVREMIGNARREILIVGYRITDVEGTITWLRDAIRRVGKITIIIDDDERCTNRSALNRIFCGPRRPRIYTHRGSEGPFYKVHAKIMIVDERELLITSANMTYHGLVQNFEMGARIRGKLAEDAQAVIRKMIRSGYFEEIT